MTVYTASKNKSTLTIMKVYNDYSAETSIIIKSIKYNESDYSYYH